MWVFAGFAIRPLQRPDLSNYFLISISRISARVHWNHCARIGFNRARIGFHSDVSERIRWGIIQPDIEVVFWFYYLCKALYDADRYDPYLIANGCHCDALSQICASLRMSGRS